MAYPNFCGHGERMVLEASQYQREPHARWFIINTVPQISYEECWLAVKMAFDSWSAVAGVTHEGVDSPQKADCTFQVSRIDGPGGTLAMMYLPGPRVQQGTFDSSEKWVLRLGRMPNGVIDFHRVARHEIGHFWGLPHGGNFLMQPRIDPNIDSPGDWEIREMVRRYGPPKSDPKPPPVPGEKIVIEITGGQVVIPGYELKKVG